METREKILEASLELFSRKGYEAVSVAEIAAAVGIKAPSLYKHFKSKQDIFEGILKTMDRRYAGQMEQLALEGADPLKAAAAYGSFTQEQLTCQVLALFVFFLQDPWIARFRRMLTVEQFGRAELSGLYSELYVDGPIAFETGIFRQLIAEGKMKDRDPKTLAAMFYGPIYLMLLTCDRQPQRTLETEQWLRAHVREFWSVYSKEGEK